jgi:hypothetical protein
MPDTICVQERLPPGAPAVLINRNHTYTDIYLPINAQQKNYSTPSTGNVPSANSPRRPRFAISRVSCSRDSGSTTRSCSTRHDIPNCRADQRAGWIDALDEYETARVCIERLPR